MIFPLESRISTPSETASQRPVRVVGFEKFSIGKGSVFKLRIIEVTYFGVNLAKSFFGKYLDILE